MKHKEFYDHHQAHMYLNNCIIRKANVPIMIEDVQAADRGGKKWRLDYRELGQNGRNVLFLPNRAIDMNPVPLGMLNGEENGVWHVSRMASRKWKVGLYSGNTHYYGHGRATGGYHKPNITGEAMRNCIMGNYPDYTTIIRRIRAGKKQTLAFSRRFCVDQGNLMFKTTKDPVGIAERGAPVLFDQFHYLKEVLEEDLNG